MRIVSTLWVCDGAGCRTVAAKAAVVDAAGRFALDLPEGWKFDAEEGLTLCPSCH